MNFARSPKARALGRASDNDKDRRARRERQHTDLKFVSPPTPLPLSLSLSPHSSLQHPERQIVKEDKEARESRAGGLDTPHKTKRNEAEDRSEVDN